MEWQDKFETWKDGKTRLVTRDKQGRFITWRFISPTVEYKPRKPLNYKYHVVIRIGYIGKIGHDRFGEISGTIITEHPLSDDQVIEKAITSQTGKDFWIDYVYPNRAVILHISETMTEETAGETTTFTDRRSL